MRVIDRSVGICSTGSVWHNFQKSVSMSMHHIQQPSTLILTGWLSWAMVLGSFQFLGVLLLLHIVGQGLSVLAAGAGRLGYIVFIFFICLPFLMSCLSGDG